jgi:hypothetical protein
MAVRFTIHYDNLAGLVRPHLRLWHMGANPSTWRQLAGTSSAPCGSCR